MGLDPRECGLERGHRACSSSIPHEPGSRAESTVDAAAIGRDQENTIRVAPNQMRRDLVGLLTQGVAEVAFDSDRLLGPGDALPANRAVWVERVTEREIVRGDRNRQSRGHRAAGADSLRIRQGQSLVESL